jgi:hypothetical protein
MPDPTRLTDENLRAYRNLAAVAGFMDPEVVLLLMVDELLAARARERAGWPQAFLSAYRAWQAHLAQEHQDERERQRLYGIFCQEAVGAAVALDRESQ